MDASAVIDLLLRSGAWEQVSRRFAPGSIHAPELLDLEVLQVLRRYRLNETLSLSRAREAVMDLAGLPIQRYSHEPFRERIWALHENLTAYDACYVALAEALEAPLVTCDRRLSRSAGHGAEIQVVS
ncbi:MAG TPA: type II toxin-antitoxin system VapC family toxin [Thermoanaerobaculia bacterium]|nr:type II toxin-antitoxin system VapC family toxin [Thermoanaerobaculia bacterium]